MKSCNQVQIQIRSYMEEYLSDFDDDGTLSEAWNTLEALVLDSVEGLQDAAEQEPVGVLLIDEYFDSNEVGDVDVQFDQKVIERLATENPGQNLPLYTRADPFEIEQLRKHHTEYMQDAESMKLAYTSEIVSLRTENEQLKEEILRLQALIKSPWYDKTK